MLLPVKLLLLGTTFISTGVSVLAGWLLYRQGVDSLHKTVGETSHVQINHLQYRLNRTWAVLHIAIANTENLLRKRAHYGWRPNVTEYAEYFHWASWSNLRATQLMYTFGSYLVPDDLQNKDIFYQEVWHDRLANGTQEWISGTYLPHQWESPRCDKRKHCVECRRVDPQTGERGDVLYHFTKDLTGKYPEGTEWVRPANWKSSDGTKYTWMGINRVVPGLTLVPNTRTVLVAYITFQPWEDILTIEDAEYETYLVVAQLASGMHSRVYAHNYGDIASASGSEEECDVLRSEASQHEAECNLRLSGMPAAVQEAAYRLNRTGPNVFLIDNAAGEEYFMRMVVVFNETVMRQTIPPMYLLWLRPIATVQDKVLGALIQLLIMCSFIFVFDCLVAALEVVLVARPLAKLQRATIFIELMDLDNAERKLDGVLVVIREVSHLVGSVRSMVASLRDYRAYIPQAVFNEIDEGCESTQSFSDGGMVHLGVPKDDGRGGSTAGMDDSASVRTHRLSIWERTTRLDRAEQEGLSRRLQRKKEMLSRDPGELHMRNATLLVATAELYANRDIMPGADSPGSPRNAHRPADVSAAMNAFVLPCLVASQKHGGIALLISPEAVVVGWNTHSSRSDHWLCAVRCANTVVTALRDEPATDDDAEEPLCPSQRVDRCGVGVDMGKTLVGHVGTERQKAPVAIGDVMLLATCLSKLAQRIFCPALLSEAVNDRVGAADSVLTRVVDVVPTCPRDEGRGAARTSLVYELVLSEQLSPRTTEFADGFRALRNMKLDKAEAAFVAHLRKCPTDFQSARLLRVVVTLKARQKATAGEYARRYLGWESLEEQEAACPDLIRGTAAEDMWKARSPVGRPVSGLGHCDATFTSLRCTIPGGDQAQNLLKRMEEEGRFAGPDAGEAGDDGSDTPALSKSLGQRQPGSPTHGGGGGGIQATMTSLRSGKSGATRTSSQQGGLPRMFSTGDESAGLRSWRRSDRKLGQGTFGEVWLAMGESGDLAALKLLALPRDLGFTKERAREAVGEVELLDRLRDDNVVSYLGSGLDGDHLVIVMEYLAGGSLEGLLQQFGGALRVSAVQRYTKDILRGLHFLHTQDPPVVHRDLKPGNVLLTIDGICKLADFGSAGEIAREVKGHGAMGTAIYMAPEQAKGCAGPPSDIWSAGVLLLQLISGELPYDLTGFNQFRFMIRLSTLAGQDSDPEGVGPQIARDRVQPDAADFAERCFNLHPDRRPTAMALLTTAFLLNPQAEARAASPNASGDSSAGQMGCAVESVLDEVVVPSAVMETVDSEEDD
eukprot:TRINITY_DN735_c0_g5_i1.p1 TRINITY_DN735_c0_g5~~TRINITY_DN735_c0_g5_i1.p1  ORF type:complete len:1293 (+),score=390.38 TRINITY_DN735_c0_g5_i1:102-3980(+)